MDHQSDMETDSSQNSFQQEWSNEELDLLEKLITKLKVKVVVTTNIALL